MDRLSSCYFCGAALDASLSEYPVVPKRLQPESASDQRVTLCPTCRRKLATVLREVVAAVDDDPEDQSGVMDESGLDPHPDPMAVGDANETGTAVEEAGSDAGLLEDTSDDETEGPLDSDEAESQSAEPDRTHPMAAADETDDADESSGTTATESASPGAVETTAAESEPESANEVADTGTDDTSDDPSLTRLEYSKVMRLLQNRQLPVDRSEIRAVAVNAYDIEPEEFDAIIDAAVDRGLIGEENGQFVAAE
ncbi:hypothetical protein NDI85_10170 [Halomicroarcula sp. S1AR25-4]|uniref:hypothetical protein n=1 Tax=Haloarcula sp. S1AR25-4 TaxID=2950538 RepID=UPI002876AF1C|nr:hypothetical protein [Halomicroarcula sp. S1AR25-4]MDS0278160.1 hypothetical protein [Halomicroarcula sp. S1AR25-4]